MAPVISTVQQLVNENTVNDFLAASEILIKFASNVLQHPQEPKYRRIRLANPTVEGKLLPVSGAMQCLFEMGFAEDGEYLSLPMSAPLSVISQIRTQLQSERTVLERSGQIRQQPAPPSTPATPSSSRSVANAPPAQSINMFQQKEAQFYRKLEGQMQHVLCYEDRRLQKKARETIPIKQLEDEATSMLANLEKARGEASGDNTGVKNLDVRDCLVLALLKWFKMSFFRWVNAPDCKQCGGKTTGVGAAQPTPEELRFKGNRVENYRCNVCGAYTRFVRYNDPGKLLETREGRCGEWANCFTLCCRALQFEARYILDWTDHVWTEVYSQSQQRWVHCDPCENACDKPLLYEKGWGKKLTYIIAFSVDDVEDVTWRYTSNFEEILKRRTECREMWLVHTLYNLDKKIWSAMPESKKNVRLRRKIVDLVEFLTPKTADGQNLSGRTTGSVEWRLARGEMGQQKASTSQPYVFKLTDSEVSAKCFHVRYSCASDRYTRVSTGESTQGFESHVHERENIFRKEEMDWKMVYLARTEGTNNASIAWKFDFTDHPELKIDTVEVRIDCKTYEDGKINWILCNDETCFPLKFGPSLQTVSELEGSSGFTLTASLSGGRGDVAWQHTQLFRQSTNDTALCPFEVKVTFR